MYDVEGNEDVEIIGCPAGINFQIIHTEADTQIMMGDKAPIAVSRDDWRSAVIGFSEAVQAFYTASSPKMPFDDWEKEGFDKFMAEWQRRHDEALRA